MAFPGGSDGKESACCARDLCLVAGLGRSPGGGHGTHSCILAWRIPWTEELGLQSMGLKLDVSSCKAGLKGDEGQIHVLSAASVSGVKENFSTGLAHSCQVALLLGARGPAEKPCPGSSDGRWTLCLPQLSTCMC